MMKLRPATGIILLGLAAGGIAAGCSYRPLYSSSVENAGVASVLSTIEIPEADTRLGQIIRNDLISSMRPGNSGSEDRYSLVLKPEVKTSEIIDRTEPEVTRDQVKVLVAYELVERRSAKVVHSGTTFSQVSYDVIYQPFADQQAKLNATERAAHQVSSDIRTRLAAYFASAQ